MAKDKLQYNSLQNLRITLLVLSSEERQIRYKQAVPFVHVPIELLAQWEEHQSLLQQRWFRELFSEAQALAMITFGDKIARFFSEHREEVPDVEHILSIQGWRDLMTAAAQLLSELEDLFPSAAAQPPR